MSEIWFWPHFVALLKSGLDVQQTHLLGQFVEQTLMLSSSYRCDQIYTHEWYNFGHTLKFVVLLKSDLDIQQTPLSIGSLAVRQFTHDPEFKGSIPTSADI
jgi:hypothetical protein